MNLKIIDKTGDHQAIQYLIKIEREIWHPLKTTTTLEEQISMQFRLNVTNKDLNNQLSEIMQARICNFQEQSQ